MAITCLHLCDKVNMLCQTKTSHVLMSVECQLASFHFGLFKGQLMQPVLPLYRGQDVGFCHYPVFTLLPSVRGIIRGHSEGTPQ